MREITEVTDVTDVRFRRVPAGNCQLAGQCWLIEEDRAIVVKVDELKMSERLCAQLNEMHQAIMRQGRWGQTPIADVRRAEQAAEGLAVGSASWRLVSGAILPDGIDAVPYEAKNRFVWLIRRGEASEVVCDEMTRYLDRIVGDGLWRQRWPDVS